MPNGVEVRRDGAIAVVEFDRADQGGFLDHDALEAFRRATLPLADSPPRVVVLQSRGPDFGRGLAIDTRNPTYEQLLQLVTRGDLYGVQERLKLLRQALDGIGRLPCPVIAAVEGRCEGASFEVALCADLRVVGASAHFGLPELSRGVLPFAGGISRLTTLLGAARAAEVLLLGRSLPAEVAAHWGLANEVVADGAASETAMRLAHALCAATPMALSQTTIAMRAATAASERGAAVELEGAARTLIKDLPHRIAGQG